MALIGQIAIAMVADSSKLVRGLAGASTAILAFEKSAQRDVARGQKSISQGFANVAAGAALLGGTMSKIMSSDAKKFYGGLAKDIITPVSAGFGKVAAIAQGAFAKLNLGPVD